MNDTGEQKTVDVTRLRFPLALVLAVLVATTSIVLAWGQVERHAANGAIHLNEQEMIKGGGLVTKRDLRRVLRSMQITCTGGIGQLQCSVVIPEVAE